MFFYLFYFVYTFLQLLTESGVSTMDANNLAAKVDLDSNSQITYIEYLTSFWAFYEETYLRLKSKYSPATIVYDIWDKDQDNTLSKLELENVRKSDKIK